MEGQEIIDRLKVVKKLIDANNIKQAQLNINYLQILDEFNRI